MRTCVVGFLVALLGVPPVVANDAKEVYRVRIVVSIERHRLLTDIFREQVSRELRDGLKSALGDLAQVSVSDEHPKLDDIQARGLGRALDGFRERSTDRTYFVAIDFNGTHYRVQTRMHDGLTGLPSPVVRHDSTRDRAFVARTATFLLERDLGLIGTITAEPEKGQIVSVEMRGGMLGVDLGKWVKKGEVFALVKVEGSAVGTHLPWALLQVVEPPKDGVCQCKLFSRYQLGPVTGVRAVMLGTTSGPVRLRLLEEKPNRELGPLSTAITVELRREGFEGEEGSRLSLTTSRGKDLDTTKSKNGTFDKIVFVSVSRDGTLRARVPIPIIDDGLIIVGVPAGNKDEDLITFRYRMLRQKVLDAGAVQAEMFKDINALSKDPKQRVAAIVRVKQALERSRTDHGKLTGERDEVQKALAKMSPKGRPTLTGINDRLRLLKSSEGDLRNTVEALEKIEKEEKDPARVAWLTQREQARLLEKEGELGEAIAKYEKAPEEEKTDELKKHLAGLKKLWEPVGVDHKAAREYIYGTFPTLTTGQLKEGTDQANKHLAVCIKADDMFGPMRLRKATLEHVKRLATEADALNPSVNIDDDKPLQAIKELLPALQKLDKDIGAYLDKKKG